MKDREPGSLRVAAAAFAASLALNASAIAAVEYAAAARTRLVEAQLKLEELRKQREQMLQFEFIEAPPKAYPQKPEAPKKFSDRDALTQGRLVDPSAASQAPPTQDQGRSDQLAQRQVGAGAPASEPRPSSPAATASPESTPADASVPRPEEESPREKEETEPGGWEPASKRPVPAEPASVPAPAAAASAASSPQAPSPASAGGPPGGVDRITTQEMSRAKISAAKLFGATSFEATGSGMGAYMKNLKERIWLEWFPYLAFQYPTEFRGSDVVLRFTLDREGKVRTVELADSNGPQVFADFCVRSVQKASPFGPIPEEMRVLIGEEDLEIYFGFHLS